MQADCNYLGVVFGSTLNWSKCIKSLAGKAVSGIKRLKRSLRELPVSTLFKIFESKVKPILLYGAEIWGTQTHKEIENIQIKFCISIIRVGQDIKK